MSIKNYDSEFCGSLPLNFTNQIQSYGVLVVLELETLKIIQVSQNIEAFFGISAASVIGKYWKEYVLAEQVVELEQKSHSSKVNRLPLLVTIVANGKKTECLAIVHIKENYLILELEKIAIDENLKVSSFLSVYQDIKYVMALLESADSLESACQLALQELKRLSGFDRIMIYQFDEDWNGKVIAEVLEDGMEPYLGLVFPASDVPRQARELYLKNPYRQIPDRSYTPVKLYPLLNPIVESFLDLSDCNLRSVAAVHTEYLKNMKVEASMSTRILKDNKLWGLISCHHRQAKFLSYEQCSVFELLSDVISSKIVQLRVADDFAFGAQLQGIQSNLLEQLYRENDIFQGLLHQPVTVLELVHGHGAVISYNRTLTTKGMVPSPDEVHNLIMWLQGNARDKVFSTSHILSIYDTGWLSDTIAGVISIPIDPERGEFILVFRNEVVQEIQWGGNPDEAIRFEKDKTKYHPRSSFQLWQQKVENRSRPWHIKEIERAENLRTLLLEYILKQTRN